MRRLNRPRGWVLALLAAGAGMFTYDTIFTFDTMSMVAAIVLAAATADWVVRHRQRDRYDGLNLAAGAPSLGLVVAASAGIGAHLRDVIVGAGGWSAVFVSGAGMGAYLAVVWIWQVLQWRFLDNHANN